MDLPTVRDNAQLQTYLQALADKLQATGNSSVADEIRRAARFFSGSPSEFLGESEQVLRKTITEAADSLSEPEIRSVESVLKQIRSAFERVGGG